MQEGRHTFAGPVKAYHFHLSPSLPNTAEKEENLALSASSVLHERTGLSSAAHRRRASAQVSLSLEHVTIDQQGKPEVQCSSLEHSVPTPWYKPLTPLQQEAAEQLNLQLLQTLKTLELEMPGFSLRETLCQKPTVSMRKPRKSNLMTRRSVGF